MTSTQPEPVTTPPGGAPKEPDEPALGDKGKQAIDRMKAERDEAKRSAKALETDMAELRKSLAEAFGVKPDPSNDSAAVLATVQEQLADLKHESAVLRLANEHQITDADDLALLGATKDPDAMGKLAARLAAKKDDGPSTPKPDLSQGSKGDQPKPESLPGVPRMAQAFDDAMNTN